MKMKEYIFENNNKVNSTVNMGFVKRMDQKVAKYRIGIQMKKGGGPRLFEL